MENENIKGSHSDMNKFRYEVSEELGAPMRYGGTGDFGMFGSPFTSGYLVKRIIEAQEKQMSNQGK